MSEISENKSVTFMSAASNFGEPEPEAVVKEEYQEENTPYILYEEFLALVLLVSKQSLHEKMHQFIEILRGHYQLDSLRSLKFGI